MTEIDIKDELNKYLQSQSLMSITTYGEEPWPAIVYYLVDENLNIYFTSNPKSTHCSNIGINSKVTLTVFDSNQGLSGDKIGVQMIGEAHVVKSLSQIKWTVKLWNKLIASNSDGEIDYKDFLEGAKSRVYKVEPKKIKFFNQVLFDSPPFKIIEL